jgi:hypothetical protein
MPVWVASHRSPHSATVTRARLRQHSGPGHPGRFRGGCPSGSLKGVELKFEDVDEAQTFLRDRGLESPKSRGTPGPVLLLLPPDCDSDRRRPDRRSGLRRSAADRHADTHCLPVTRVMGQPWAWPVGFVRPGTCAGPGRAAAWAVRARGSGRTAAVEALAPRRPSCTRSTPVLGPGRTRPAQLSPEVVGLDRCDGHRALPGISFDA